MDLARDPKLRTASVVVAVLGIAACAQPRRPEGAAPTPMAGRFAASLADAFAVGDAGAVAARFAPGADLGLVGEARTCHGRAGIEDAVRQVFARYADARLGIGRIWVDATAAVVELVFSGTRDAHPVGVVGAAVIAFDSGGLVSAARIYFDVPTLVGQVDRSRLPDGAEVRAPVTTPPGTGTTVSRHTATEAANLAAAGHIWARLDAHDAAGTLAPSSDDYVYDDFSGPRPLDRPATQRLIARFVAFVPDFAIAAKPTYFAAGDDVITESVEHMTARGQAVVLHGLDVKRFANGRVTREWQYANGAEALARLAGVVVELR